MWQLITGLRPVVPPECSVEQFLEPDGRVVNSWTYGGLLLDDVYGDQDIDLRRVVAHCMGKSLPQSWCA